MESVGYICKVKTYKAQEVRGCSQLNKFEAGEAAIAILNSFCSNAGVFSDFERSVLKIREAQNSEKTHFAAQNHLIAGYALKRHAPMLFPCLPLKNETYWQG